MFGCIRIRRVVPGVTGKQMWRKIVTESEKNRDRPRAGGAGAQVSMGAVFRWKSQETEGKEDAIFPGGAGNHKWRRFGSSTVFYGGLKGSQTPASRGVQVVFKKGLTAFFGGRQVGAGGWSRPLKVVSLFYRGAVCRKVELAGLAILTPAIATF